MVDGKELMKMSNTVLHMVVLLVIIRMKELKFRGRDDVIFDDYKVVKQLKFSR